MDLSGVFLAVISLTGIGLLLCLRKVRASDLTVLAVGGLVFLLLLSATF